MTSYGNGYKEFYKQGGDKRVQRVFIPEGGLAPQPLCPASSDSQTRALRVQV